MPSRVRQPWVPSLLPGPTEADLDTVSLPGLSLEGRQHPEGQGLRSPELPMLRGRRSPGGRRGSR